MELPKRKPNRLTEYDYSTPNAYFITICTEKRENLFWKDVGAIIDRPENVPLTNLGTVVRQSIHDIPSHYPTITVDHAVIMPNHIHIIMILDNKTAGASPRPTITDIICTYKSLTTIACKKNGFDGKLFQTSFYEHIIRDQNDGAEIAKYIYENPTKWQFDSLFVEDEN